MLLLFNAIPDTSVFIARQGQTQFTLRPCRNVFAFSDQGPDDTDNMMDEAFDLRDNSDVYCHLKRNAHEYCVADCQPNWVPDVTESDGFIAIGWLVESNESGFPRTTNYVVCLNLSTKPRSVWIIHGYRQRDSDPHHLGYLRRTNIPDCQPSYNDPLWDHEESHTLCLYRGKAINECSKKTSLLNPQKPGYMEQDAPWDIALLYNDIADWPQDEKLAKGDATLTTFGPADLNLRVKYEELNGLKIL